MSGDGVGLTDHFMAKFEVAANGCWVWTRGRDQDGYASYWMPGVGGCRAHRFAYELARGPIPVGLVVDHLCRVRHCVNPEHLELVTPRENTLRGTSPPARHVVKTHCPSGHPYSGENLIIERTGRRRCRECSLAAHRANRAKNRGAA